MDYVSAVRLVPQVFQVTGQLASGSSTSKNPIKKAKKKACAVCKSIGKDGTDCKCVGKRGDPGAIGVIRKPRCCARINAFLGQEIGQEIHKADAEITGNSNNEHNLAGDLTFCDEKDERDNESTKRLDNTVRESLAEIATFDV
ncbi:hypothetical protein B0H13DRAFT_1851389 [Mycena leptocephala]|nr:hypothetical protein B0H13DRAFT_1851389 [Mycena leptocephala]